MDKEVNTNCCKYKEKVESSCRYKRHCTIKVNEGCSKMPSSGTFNHVNITWICINAINYQGKTYEAKDVVKDFLHMSLHNFDLQSKLHKTRTEETSSENDCFIKA